LAAVLRHRSSFTPQGHSTSQEERIQCRPELQPSAYDTARHVPVINEHKELNTMRRLLRLTLLQQLHLQQLLHQFWVVLQQQRHQVSIV